MKLLGISDLHGYTPDIELEADIACICGDVVPLNIQRNVIASRFWFDETFIPWMCKLKVEKVYLIAGNHDFFLQSYSEADSRLLNLHTKGKVIYLKDQLASYIDSNGKEFLIYGTPWCHQFGNWPFMLSDDGLKEKFDKIPYGLDILLTHDCPYGTGDQCLLINDLHRGNKPLRDAVLEKSPAYILTGHLHSANHNEEILGKTKVINCSLVDEGYSLYYRPLYLEIE